MNSFDVLGHFSGPAYWTLLMRDWSCDVKCFCATQLVKTVLGLHVAAWTKRKAAGLAVSALGNIPANWLCKAICK
jgi:hypothetical protein